jgi:uncharacterized protein YbaR (Trm112 family)
MYMDRDLVSELRCPLTLEPLVVLPPEDLRQINRLIAAGRLRYMDGTTVSPALEEALITLDRRIIYRVVTGIPVMLAARGIPTDQLPPQVSTPPGNMTPR